MLNNVEGMLQQYTGGGGDTQQLEQATSDHVESMGSDDLVGHLRTAAQNMNQNGQSGMAQQVESMISERQSNPEDLKSAAVSFIRNDPQVLTHFAPSFAQGILNRVI